MNICLFGNGKMGQEIKIASQKRHHCIAAIVDSKTTLEDKKKSLREADVCIDFTLPEFALQHLRLAAECRCPIVMGTTGWDHQEEEAKHIVKEFGIGFLYSPNFSIGMNLFIQLAEQAAAQLEGYSTSLWEAHHRHKKDAPSGTAKHLAKVVQEKSGKEIKIHSTRYGDLPGTHSLFFESMDDKIFLSHEAKSRTGFANGAVLGAEWLQGRTGYFTMRDFLERGIKTIFQNC